MGSNRTLQALHGVKDRQAWSKLQEMQAFNINMIRYKQKEYQKSTHPSLQETYISTRTIDVHIEPFGRINTVKVQHCSKNLVAKFFIYMLPNEDDTFSVLHLQDSVNSIKFYYKLNEFK